MSKKTAPSTPTRSSKRDRFQVETELNDGSRMRATDYYFKERYERAIEAAFQQRSARLNLDFCDKTYVIYLPTMMQYERDNPRKLRMIKREGIRPIGRQAIICFSIFS
ncbi:hypothetical protein GCK72_002989 [Caenorhabditis remanei]|uniref:WWE domain-containing protein n=1 Tax=Caenorhabditis remanei TaxID=31234 RepID=A0A6A5HXF2_CAERE|nr:hypothetical protein GCK72_002989 [Caenorhabditis remanei]KAF1771163.1 hypothetical protein GCK72_002989 [Caenorhabditis remanei]